MSEPLYADYDEEYDTGWHRGFVVGCLAMLTAIGFIAFVAIKAMGGGSAGS